MNAHSASAAIWPALERTCAYLFRPFKVERFLKLASVATLSEGFLVSFRFAAAQGDLTHSFFAALQSLPATRLLPLAILAALALFALSIYCFLLITRLRFAFVHSVIHHTSAIRPALKLYSDEADRFFSAAMLVWLTFLVALSLTVSALSGLAFALGILPGPGATLNPVKLLLLYLPGAVIACVLFLAGGAAQVALNDLILPHMALEGAPFRKAWTDVRAHIAANKESFLAYFILRMLLPIAAGLALGLLAWVVAWMVFGVLSISAAGFAAMLAGAQGWRTVLLYIVQTIFVLLGLGTGAAIAVAFAGPLGVFMRSYALNFYGRHYHALGNLLDPPIDAARSLEESMNSTS